MNIRDDGGEISQNINGQSVKSKAAARASKRQRATTTMDKRRHGVRVKQRAAQNQKHMARVTTRGGGNAHGARRAPRTARR